MEGFLRALVLKSVSDQERNGYALMKAIGECTGKKPSPGSIYPLLAALESEKLLASRAEGKGTAYSITTKGKKALKELALHKQQLMVQQLEFIAYLARITGKGDEWLKEALQREPSERFIAANLPAYAELQRQIAIIGTGKEADKDTERTKRVLEESVRRLKRISKEGRQ